MSFIDPGNAGGSVIIPDSPRGRHHGDICPTCHEVFSSALELKNHVNSTHPLVRPRLVVDGQAMSRHWVVRKLPAQIDVRFERTDNAVIRIDGSPTRAVTQDGLRDALLERAEGHLDLQLSNQSFSTTYEIVIRIPAQTAVAAADRLFLQNFSQPPTLSTLERFSKAIKKESVDTEYARKLGDYVLAVLVKDRAPGIDRTFADHRDLYGAALSVLADFDRPIALSCSACARLALNDFDKPFKETSSSLINRAMAYFQNRSGNGLITVKSSEETLILPVDQTLREILQALGAGLPHTIRPDYRAQIARLEAMARSNPSQNGERLVAPFRRRSSQPPR